MDQKKDNELKETMTFISSSPHGNLPRQYEITKKTIKRKTNFFRSIMISYVCAYEDFYSIIYYPGINHPLHYSELFPFF